jgi:hypothetical protein
VHGRPVFEAFPFEPHRVVHGSGVALFRRFIAVLAQLGVHVAQAGVGGSRFRSGIHALARDAQRHFLERAVLRIGAEQVRDGTGRTGGRLIGDTVYSDDCDLRHWGPPRLYWVRRTILLFSLSRHYNRATPSMTR